jgi:PAS domain S-box-containing protein
MPKEKILIVEDQEVIHTNIKFILERNGYLVNGIATSGQDAIDRIGLDCPNLVLMDIGLPGDIDGIETAQKIREKWDIPIVYISAYNSKEILDRAKETDVYGFITKDDSLQKQLPVVIEFALYKHKTANERYKVYLEQKETEEKFRSILNATLDGIVLLDRQGRIIFFNRAAERILGYSEKEVFGTSFYELIEPFTSFDVYKKSFKEYYETGRSDILQQIIELTYFRHDEDMMFLEIYFNTFQLHGKNNACIVIRDASLKKETEGEFERIIEELQISRDMIENNANEMNILNMKLFESEEKLQELNNDKDKFFSIIAHDLKGPFQGLLGYSQLIFEHLDGLSKEEIKDFSQELHESASQLFKLLENLLEWSRIQRGVMEFKPQNIFIREVVEGTVEILKPNAHQKDIKLLNEVDPELIAFADYNMINTVIRNLISNAIKFTNAGGEIRITSGQFDEYFVLISVSDNGVGMTEDEIDKIFRIDVHHTKTGTNQESGTGLGLVLCRDLVEKNDGNISVESIEGNGSTFSFTLPAARN